MTTRGPGKHPGTFDDVVRAIATLEVSIGTIIKTQESIKGTLKTIPPRLDTMTAEITEVKRLVHLHANCLQTLTNETAELAAARNSFEEAFRDFRIMSEARTIELAKTQKLFESVLELVEERVRTVRDDVADIAHELQAEDVSGVMDKPRM